MCSIFINTLLANYKRQYTMHYIKSVQYLPCLHFLSSSPKSNIGIICWRPISLFCFNLRYQPLLLKQWKEILKLSNTGSRINASMTTYYCILFIWQCAQTGFTLLLTDKIPRPLANFYEFSKLFIEAPPTPEFFGTLLLFTNLNINIWYHGRRYDTYLSERKTSRTLYSN